MRAHALFKDVGWLFTQLLGFGGVFLIGYSVWVANQGAPWEPIERLGPFISQLLTVVGTLVTAVSIYIPSRVLHAPWQQSRYIISPLVVGACIVAIWVLVRSGSLPGMLVNGFGLLAISGGLKRILPNPNVPA